jgi:hypothetical protein
MGGFLVVRTDQRPALWLLLSTFLYCRTFQNTKRNKGSLVEPTPLLPELSNLDKKSTL